MTKTIPLAEAKKSLSAIIKDVDDKYGCSKGRCVLRSITLDKRRRDENNQSMPRQARLDAPGALHHIMVRGIDKTVIFRDDRDKIKFLEKMCFGKRGCCQFNRHITCTIVLYLLI